ncbi:hypothetical protein Bca4012_009892 [Brassica carinata]
MSQHRQTLLYSHSKVWYQTLHQSLALLSQNQNQKDQDYLLIYLYSLGAIEERKHQKQQTQAQLSEHVANNRNNKKNSWRLSRVASSGAVPAFDGRKNIYSPVEFQEDSLEFFANLPIPSCNTLIKCSDLHEKLTQKGIDKMFRVNMRLVSKFDG